MAKKATTKIGDLNIRELVKNLPRPDEIKAYLDKYVIGQSEAKKVLSVAVYNHYKRIYNNKYNSKMEVELDKNNVFLIGPTGCGKTMLVKAIAKLIDVPCYIQDCTKITAAGYVGSDVEECLVGLLRNAGGDIKKAQMGIVMLDEVDKIATKGAGPSITRDVSGECVQQSLLKIVEGDLVGCMPEGGRKHPEMPLNYIDTTNILFIASGAFVGLDKIIMRRVGTNKMGFDGLCTTYSNKINVEEHPYQYVTSQDLRDFGFIAEFVGRFQTVTNVEELSKEDLVTILTEPKNSVVKQYTEMLSFDNIKLEFKRDALDEIASIAIQMKTGARGLRSIVEKIMIDVMFEAPKMAKEHKVKIVIVTKEMVLEKTNKNYIR